MTNRAALKSFSTGPLHRSEELKNYQRLPELVEAVRNEVVYSPGGCLLITGYRGVGKTSFANKVLYEAETRLDKDKRLIIVRLNLAPSASADQLLRRLIRELYHASNRVGVYARLSADIRQKLDIAFLRTSSQVKTALSEGLKNAIAQSEGEQNSRSRSATINPNIGVASITSSLASLSFQTESRTTREETVSMEASSERGVELEFLEYDEEVAENDLSELIDLLSGLKVDFGHATDAVIEIKKPEFLWKHLPPTMSIFRRTLRNHIELVPASWNADLQELRLVFVLDEIDKMTVEQAEETFRSLKNLLLKGNVTFLLISGKEFYYEWLQKKASEDDLFFSLFSQVIHIPLFSEQEFRHTARSLSSAFPEGLLLHLIFRAKGTPREFFRELLRHTSWHNRRPVIEIENLDQQTLEISSLLYRYIQKIYEPVDEDKRIDPGIKDYVRRSLHNWLEWMTLLVCFTKASLLYPGTSPDSTAEKSLFYTRATSTFDSLFTALRGDRIIEENGRIGDEPTYTFTPEIKEKLEEIDSSISSVLHTQELLKRKELNQLLVEADRMKTEGNYQKGLNLLQKADLVAPGNRQVEQLKETLRKSMGAAALMELGNRQFDEGQYGRAYETYQQASKQQSRLPGLEKKQCRAELCMGLGEVTEAYASGDFMQVIDLLNHAIKNTRDMTDIEVVELRQEASDELEKLEKVAHLSQELENDLEIDFPRALQTFSQLKEIAPKSRQVAEFKTLLEEQKAEWQRLEMARILLQEGDFTEAEIELQKLSESNSKQVSMEAAKLAEQIHYLHAHIERANRFLASGDIQSAEKSLEELEKNGIKLLDRMPQFIELQDRILQKRKVLSALAIVESSITAEDFEEAWEHLGVLQEVCGSEGSDYRKTLRRLRAITLERAENLVSELDLADQSVGKESESCEGRTVPNSRAQLQTITNIKALLEPLLKIVPEDLEAEHLLENAKEQAGFIQTR